MKRQKMVPTIVERIVEKVTEEKATIVDDGVDAFSSLMGKNVILFCAVYSYSGKLVGVNGENVLLSDCKMIFDTGAFTAQDWKLAEKLPMKETFIQKGMIESFGEVSR